MQRPSCGLSPKGQNRDRFDLAWIAAAFLICPCHLPITLALAAAVLSGTTAGVLLAGHLYLAGGVVSILWLLATWNGFRLLHVKRQPAEALQLKNDH